MSHTLNRNSPKIEALTAAAALLLCVLLATTNASAQDQSALHNQRPVLHRASNTADAFPYRAVAKIVAYFPSGAAWDGTGVFVSADGVFTAAHNVYRPDLGGMATRVEIMPGYNNGSAPFGSTHAKQIEVDPQYIRSLDKEYDFAAILTTTRLGDRSGWLGYNVPSNYSGAVAIIGYPDDDEYGWDGNSMYISASAGRLSYGNKIEYTAPTFFGMSGAPIIIMVGSDYRVIGVHNSGGKAYNRGGQVNLGTRFFDSILSRFPPDPNCNCR